MNFLTFLKRFPEARKVFGQRELKIIEKQLMGINLTQSEKNRLSRDIRKKLDFIKQAAVYGSEFNLKKGARIKEIVLETKEIILEDILYPKIKKIFIFGSTVENTRTFRSDIDLAVEFFQANVSEGTSFRQRILGKSNSLVDVQVYNLLPEKIKREINAKGRVIYEQPLTGKD